MTLTEQTSQSGTSRIIVAYGDNPELIENYCAINGVKLI